MTEVVIRSVRKMPRADWPSRAMSFSYRPARFDRKIDWFENKLDSGTFYQQTAEDVVKSSRRSF